MTDTKRSTRQQRYKIARPEVADQLMDGEVVVIHFGNGKYHGLRGSGVRIWQWLDEGDTQNVIIAKLRGCFLCDGADVDRLVDEFVQRLEAEDLIRPLSSAAETAGLTLVETEPTEPLPPAEIDTLDDMQDYLALDPVHDVDEQGWPNVKARSGG